MNFMKKTAVVVALASTLTLSGCGFIIPYRSKMGQLQLRGQKVQNQYQRRADLVPNLVNVVKGLC